MPRGGCMRVSDFMLERYRLGELDGGDQKAVNEALAADENLRSRLKTLDDSDRELRMQYPVIVLTKAQRHGDKRINWKLNAFPGKGHGGVTRYAGIAAVVLMCIILPAVYFSRSGISGRADASPGAFAETSIGHHPGERAKGSSAAGYELSLYLKGDSEILLADQALLGEGNTVQIAYTAPAGEKYGVIFSVDGRSVVTIHYPYRKDQSSLLVSGRRTFLNEAYTLDDAPGYEVFVMVVSDEPLDVDTVLRKANSIAETSAFEGCEVETLTVLKK